MNTKTKRQVFDFSAPYVGGPTAANELGRFRKLHQVFRAIKNDDESIGFERFGLNKWLPVSLEEIRGFVPLVGIQLKSFCCRFISETEFRA